MSEDLKTDHVKLESPSILTKKLVFARPLGGGLAPFLLSTPVDVDVHTVVLLGKNDDDDDDDNISNNRVHKLTQ